MKHKKDYIKEIMKMQKEIEQYGGDKLMKEILQALTARWLDEILKFDIFLRKNFSQDKKLINRFHKIVEIIGKDINY